MENIKEPLKTPIVIKNILPSLALLTAATLWGGSFVGTRAALRSLDPMALMWIRMMIALVVILPFIGKLKPEKYKKGDWRLLLPMVIFQPCLYFLLESNALRLTTSTQAGVISAAVPVLVSLGAWFFLSESINKITISGLVLSVGGVIFLTISQGTESLAENPILGNSMEALAMVFAASNMLLIKKLSSRYNSLTLTAMQIIAGALFFSPGLISLTKMDNSLWTVDLILILLFMGVFVSLGAFGLYNWGMSHLPASKASAFINLVPVTAIIAGWVILGESLNFRQSLAAIVVLAGVLISQRFERRKVKMNPDQNGES
ncbi:MAG: DMT family transporter [Spirochaetaceae bacterium]|jgi:drug/metabolite transporter (DMT)-like permease|nr:DMT family transporter [Spirochaetaceae bacterium]